MKKLLFACLLSSAAIAEVSFELPESFLLDDAGEIVDGIKRGSFLDVAKQADALPDGEYTLYTPDSTITVKNEAEPPVEPPVEPPPVDPPVEPPVTPPVPPPAVTDWQKALLPFVPPVGEVAILPNSAMTPVLLQDDGTAACAYLKCGRSTILMNDWSGMAFDEERGIFRFVAMGGHGDHGANSVYEFHLGDQSWHRVFDYAQPKAPFPDLVDADGDGVLDCAELEQGPMGSHGYDSIVYLPNRQATLKMRNSGYGPTRPKCERTDFDNRAVLWHDAGGYEFTNLPGTLASTAYDPLRNVIYTIQLYGRGHTGPNGEENGRYEIDADTLESTYMGGSSYASSHQMDFDPETRLLCDNFRGIGVNCRTVTPEGEWVDGYQAIAPRNSDDRSRPWQGGLAISQGVVVNWAGGNLFYQNADGVETRIEAGGETIPLGEGYKRIYSKFHAVMPGVFMGITDDEIGWVTYRAF